MQARKRAKPVKFGKQITKKPEKKPEEEKSLHYTVTHTHEEKRDNDQISIDVKVPQEPENKPQEIKKEEETPKKEAIPAEEVSKPPAVSVSEEKAPKQEEPEPAQKEQEQQVSEEKEEIREQEPEAERNERSRVHVVENTTSYFDKKDKKKKGNLFFYFIVIALTTFLVSLAFITGFYYIFQGKNSQTAVENQPQATPTPDEIKSVSAPAKEATPEPTKAVNIADYSVKIENGSGITGEAAKLRNELAAEGYTISSVGNADKSTYEQTEIIYKKSVKKQVIAKLKTFLKESYELAPETTLPASSSSEPDITIIIGKNPAQ